MKIAAPVAQLRTTDLEASIRFYTQLLGMTLGFRYQDFYAGIETGGGTFHLKLADEPDPSIGYVREAGFHLYFGTDDAAALAAEFARRGVNIVEGVHDTAWSTREFVVEDDQGHTLYFGESLSAT